MDNEAILISLEEIAAMIRETSAVGSKCEYGDAWYRAGKSHANMIEARIQLIRRELKQEKMN